jgi:hypothetical protein
MGSKNVENYFTGVKVGANVFEDGDRGHYESGNLLGESY